MENATISIAIGAVLLIILLRSIYGFVVYMAVLMFYPTYLVVGIGTADISASRIAICVLLLKCLAAPQLRQKFRWCGMDTWVAFSMVVYTVVICVTHPLLEALENRAGFLMDTWFPYLSARLCFTSRASIVTAIKSIAVLLVPLALLGIIEATTGWQPYASLGIYCPWRAVERYSEARFGLSRAIGPFGHSILFGLFFTILMPFIYYLRYEKNHWGVWAYVLSGLMLLGAMSSMSSGPWVMMTVVIFCLAIEKYKKLVKPVFIFILLACVFVEIVSNRPFYHVIVSYANPLGGSGWHRAKLIDCAIMFFDEWWLAGYGDRDPGWGPYFGMGHTDLTNEFILAGVRYGILGIISLCGTLTYSILMLVRLYNSTKDLVSKSLFWALGSTTFALIITFMSVSFFGQITSVFYCFLGFVGSSPNFVAATGAANNCKL